MAILGKAGVPIVVHGAIDAIARVFQNAGVHLPPYERYDAATYDGTRALIWPPSATQPKALRNKPSRSVVLTGWAVDKNAAYRYGADAAIPLSDHADYAALLRYIELAQPRKVLLNHGWRDFVWRLRRLGVDATYLGANEQLALFWSGAHVENDQKLRLRGDERESVPLRPAMRRPSTVRSHARWSRPSL